MNSESDHNLSPEQQLKSIPEEPGVYRFYDKRGKLLYIGKAVNLQK